MRLHCSTDESDSIFYEVHDIQLLNFLKWYFSKEYCLGLYEGFDLVAHATDLVTEALIFDLC